MINIALVDDHEIIRSGLKKLLSLDKNIKIVCEFSDYDTVISEHHKYDIDVYLLDISLGEGKNGFDLVEALRREDKEVKVILLSVHKESYYVIKAIGLGINGYLHKDVSIDDLLQAIHTVHSGKKYFSQEISEVLVENMNRDMSLPKLTNREIEVLSLIVEGHSTKDIADQISVSPRTVDSHRINIMNKFGFKNSTEMVRKLTKDNLI